MADDDEKKLINMMLLPLTLQCFYPIQFVCRENRGLFFDSNGHKLGVIVTLRHWVLRKYESQLIMRVGDFLYSEGL